MTSETQTDLDPSGYPRHDTTRCGWTTVAGSATVSWDDHIGMACCKLSPCTTGVDITIMHDIIRGQRVCVFCLLDDSPVKSVLSLTSLCNRPDWKVVFPNSERRSHCLSAYPEYIVSKTSSYTFSPLLFNPRASLETSIFNPGPGDLYTR